MINFSLSLLELMSGSGSFCFLILRADLRFLDSFFEEEISNLFSSGRYYTDFLSLRAGRSTESVVDGTFLFIFIFFFCHFILVLASSEAGAAAEAFSSFALDFLESLFFNLEFLD